jgi:hypothetical protein
MGEKEQMKKRIKEELDLARRSTNPRTKEYHAKHAERLRMDLHDLEDDLD